MGFNFASKIFLLHLLLVMCAHGSRTIREMMTTKVHREEMMNLNPSHDARPEEDNFLRLPSMNGGIGEDNEVEAQDEQLLVEHVHSNPLAHLDHIDKSFLVFFTLNDLQVGNRMQIYFPKRDPLSSPRFLSREEANAIPFSYQQLPYLLEFFSFTPGSPQAIATENTIRECETKAIKGETKTCATSLESMLDFAQKKLGLETEVKVLSTTHLTKSSTLLQNYTIDGVPKEISAPKMVACHTMPYPYAVFYCHNQESQNKVFLVSLTGDNGDRVEALAVCHMDTSQWSRNHVSFTVLGVEPGSSNVCHFFPDDNLVYVPMPSMASTAYVM
ncbi:hypothetical protein K2173_013618 [Erythroxylum novogranatense]|uniref:BURP domain-containing protein n=1 Tax=Erythroxylum novogranatense TaxID=1862640 RepID=A0AAV8TLC3_9ROSI|nr:hypothetical protein K2173_013618 [Erythroxylum novogranatense]